MRQNEKVMFSGMVCEVLACDDMRAVPRMVSLRLPNGGGVYNAPYEQVSPLAPPIPPVAPAPPPLGPDLPEAKPPAPNKATSGKRWSRGR